MKSKGVHPVNGYPPWGILVKSAPVGNIVVRFAARRLPIRVTPRFTFRPAMPLPRIDLAHRPRVVRCALPLRDRRRAAYRTEALRAVIGAEAARGHWLYPVPVRASHSITKPPGHYAAVGLCSLPFGRVTEWSARLPSVAAATAAVFLMGTGCSAARSGEWSGVLAAVHRADVGASGSIRRRAPRST